MEPATSSPPMLSRRERREAALRAQAAPVVHVPPSPPVHADAAPVPPRPAPGVARTSARTPRAVAVVAPDRTAEDSAPYLTRRQRREMLVGAAEPASQHAEDATTAQPAPNRGPGHLANAWPVPFTHHGPQVSRVTSVEVTGSGRAVPASVPVPAVAAPSVVGPTCPEHAADVVHEHPLQDAPALEHDDDRPHVLTAELEALFLEPSAVPAEHGGSAGGGRGVDAGSESRPSGERHRWVPRVAVLTSLAVATIAVPLTGAATGDTSVDNGGRPEGPSLLDAVSASGTTAKLPDSIRSLGDGTERDQAASRSESRDSIADCDPTVEPTGMNGQLPDSQLCELWQKGYYLANPAATAISAMNDAFKARFGRNMCLVAAYRPLAEQYTLARTRAGYAAEPGTSNHGLGLAVDFCSSETGNAEVYQWLRANGPTYGWDNPTWARAGGGGSYEPWHFNYMPLTTKMGVL